MGSYPKYQKRDLGTRRHAAGSGSSFIEGGGNLPSAPAFQIYSYTLVFEPNGNVASDSDTVLGTWNYTYDSLNRLTGASATAGTCNGMNIGWTYDAWGNREDQSGTGTGNCTIVQPSLTFIAEYNNRIDQFLSDYDLAGNLKGDGSNTYTYDAEGRVSSANGSTQYIYDAEGQRVAKETMGGSVTASYVLGLGGEELTEMNGSGQWQHSNIYAMGRVIATYDAQGTRFHLDDALGSRREQVRADGTVGLWCFNYPFGDGLNCWGPDEDATEQHFTGKFHDAETGNDYFGARYDDDNYGRFLTPDGFRNDTHTSDPQSWNLYSYVRNNPLRFVDPLGTDVRDGEPSCYQESAINFAANDELDAAEGQYLESIAAWMTPVAPADKPQTLHHDANHTHTLIVREVSGQAGNPAGHVTVQVDGGKEVGFGPAQPMTKKQILENASVPGAIEPRAAGARTLDAVTIYLTADEASHAQGTIDARAANPGNYQVSGRSCVDLGETVVHSTGARAPNDLLPSALIRDIRSMQIQDNSNQAP